MSISNHSKLKSLLSNRAILKPYPDDGPSIPQLAAAALKLINQSQDFSSLVEEVDWEKEQSSQELLHLIDEQIRFKPSFQGFSNSEVLENLIIQTGKKYIQAEDRERIERLSKLAMKLKREGIIKLDDVGKEILSKKALVTDAKISWLLAWSGMAPIDAQFLQWSKETSTQFSQYISDLVGYCMSRTEVGEGIIQATVNVAFGEDVGRRQRALTVLKKFMMKLLDNIYNGGQPELQWLRMDGLDKTVTSKWGLIGLTTMLQHRPGVKVGEAIKYQGDWKVASNIGLGSLCSGLLQTQNNCDELVNLVGRVVSRVEVNWKAVLTLMTISLELMPRSDNKWHSLVTEMVRSGLDESDQEAFLSGLLLARQASLAATPCFPSYSSWFQSNFGDEQTSLTSYKKSHEFLISQLTSLVPWEPAYTMKVHLTRSPAVPKKIKEVLDEYKRLVRTQLSALGELANEVLDLSNNVVSEETFNQVKKFIDDYSNSSKIPPSMMEIEMFRKPFFNSQIVPALLLAKLPAVKEAARVQMVELLYSKGKIPGPIYNSFISGELRHTSAVPESKVGDDECTQENLSSRLSLLSHLDKHEDIRLVLGQVSYIIRTLLASSSGVDEQLSLPSVLSAAEDQISASVHSKVLQAYLTNSRCRTEILPMLATSVHMLRHTLHWILTATVFNEGMIDIISFLKDTGRSNIKVKESMICVIDLLGSMYQPIHQYDQLDVIENVLNRLSQNDNCKRSVVKLSHLKHRKYCLAGEDIYISRTQLDIEDVRIIFELEAIISDKLDKLDHLQKLHLLLASIEYCGFSNLDLASCLINTLVGVWEFSGRLPSNALLMVQAVSKIVKREVWLELWRQKLMGMTEEMITIFQLVPDMLLECEDDVTPLVDNKDMKLFCLCLPLTKILVYSKLTVKCPVMIHSIGYWVARGCVHPPQNIDAQIFLSWRDSRVEDADSARVGLVLLAEEYLKGRDNIFHRQRPIIKKLMQIVDTAGQNAVESVFSDDPDLWFQSVLSSILSSTVSFLLVILCTTESIFRPSPKFCVGTLLPRLSQLMEGKGDPTDWDVGYASVGLVKKLHEYKEDMIRQELHKLDIHLHKDLEELLHRYLQYE